MPLSDAALRKAKPSNKAQRLFDGGGLFVEISPSGGKWWRLKYRLGGKEKRLSLGTYPDTGLADARENRDAARKLLAQGVDPSAERQAAKQSQAQVMLAVSDIFKAMARTWMARQEVAEITANKTRWVMETFLFPEIGDRPIAEITPRELLLALRRIEQTGKLETAKRARIKAGQVFRFAMLEGNPYLKWPFPPMLLLRNPYTFLYVYQALLLLVRI